MSKNTLKEKYILNENKLENVINSDEQAGIGVIFDYIENDKQPKMENIYIILKLHNLLYSKTPFNNFGGSFRNTEAYISGSKVSTSTPRNIPEDIHNLSHKFDEAIKVSKIINETKSKKLIRHYLNLVLEIKCRLVEIHPFSDGNGRTSRALVNLMLKKINIDPIVIEIEERDKYLRAMNEAIVNKALKDINEIYIKKLTKK